VNHLLHEVVEGCLGLKKTGKLWIITGRLVAV